MEKNGRRAPPAGEPGHDATGCLSALPPPPGREPAPPAGQPEHRGARPPSRPGPGRQPRPRTSHAHERATPPAGATRRSRTHTHAHAHAHAPRTQRPSLPNARGSHGPSPAGRQAGRPGAHCAVQLPNSVPVFESSSILDIIFLFCFVWTEGTQEGAQGSPWLRIQGIHLGTEPTSATRQARQAPSPDRLSSLPLHTFTYFFLITWGFGRHT